MEPSTIVIIAILWVFMTMSINAINIHSLHIRIKKLESELKEIRGN